MEPFIGQIQMFGFNFPPRGWAHCDGQILSISTNTALFSLLGTTFGGDGRTTFGLPDLRGRTPVHVGSGPGLSTISWGQKSGVETISFLPAHAHGLSLPQAVTGDGQTGDPAGAVPAASTEDIYSTATSDTTTGGATSTASAGSSGVVGVRNPFVGIYYSIALQGIFPSRN